MNVQKELLKLEKEQTKLRIKFGVKFKNYYDDLTRMISANHRRIDELRSDTMKHENALTAVRVALAHTDTEV